MCITDVLPALQLFWTVSCCLSSRALQLTTSKRKKTKKTTVREPRLPRLVHLRQRQTGGEVKQEMFESTGNTAKTFSIARPHTIISSVTHLHTHTRALKHL